MMIDLLLTLAAVLAPVLAYLYYRCVREAEAGADNWFNRS